MKKLNYFISALMLVWIMQSCQQGSRDTVKIAEERNGQKIISESDPGLDVYTEENFTDANFAVFAADDGLTEVALGELAQLNTFEQKIKDFGKMMAGEHSKINKELVMLALKKGISLPPSPGEKHVKMIQDITQDVGNDFDNHYIDAMINLLKKDIHLFDMASKHAVDSDIKAFANNNLPALKKQLELTESLK